MLAVRGLVTALVEADDFAAGTSSKSSKMRYLLVAALFCAALSDTQRAFQVGVGPRGAADVALCPSQSEGSSDEPRTPLLATRIGEITIRNRVIFGPHVTNHWLGHVADADTVAYYEERAKGGVGMVIIGAASVDENADMYPANQPGLWNDAVVPGLADVGRAVHRYGSRVLIQLIHPGLHQNPERDRSHPPAVSASQIPDAGRPFYVPRAVRDRRDAFAGREIRVSC